MEVETGGAFEAPMEAESDSRSAFADSPARERTAGATADAALRRAAARAPEAVAFADPSNRAALGLGPAGETTFAEADALATRIAAEFAEYGLRRGDRLALQLPNIRELPLLMAAAWRAGLIAVPLPTAWRLDELHRAFAQIEPAAIATVGRFEGHDHADAMREAAARHLSVRHVFGLDGVSRDGVTPIAGWFREGAREAGGAPPGGVGSGDPAVMTWAASASGPWPVPRTHAELLALGWIAARELSLSGDDVLLTPYPLSGVAAVGSLLMPALLAGAPLILHQPFDREVFTRELRERGVTYTALPGPVLKALAGRGDLAGAGSALTRVGRVLPWPHARAVGSADAVSEPAVHDIHNLGELALVFASATAGSGEAGLPLGKLAVWGGDNGDIYLETRVRGSLANGDGGRRLTGTLFVRGPCVPAGPFDCAGALARSLLRRDAQGYLDTGIRCTVDGNAAGRCRCERDGDLLYHGGVAIPAAELDRLYADYPDFLDAAVFATGDPVMGDRIFAAVVPRQDRTPSLDGFRRFLAEKGVAPYKAPDQLVIVDAIPREPGGAVLRERLPDHM